MTNQQPEVRSVDLRLRATYVPDGEPRLQMVSVGPSSGSTIITPIMEKSPVGVDVCVLDVVTGVPFDELATLLDAIVEGLRNGVES